MQHKERTQQIIEAAKAVHNELGSGLPHNFYRSAMELELREVGQMVEVDKCVKVHFRDHTLGELFADFCMNGEILCVVVDGPEISPDAYGLMRTLLQSTGLEVGLLLKFGGSRLDIRRVEASAKNPQAGS